MKRRQFLQWAATVSAGAMARRSLADFWSQHCRLRIAADGRLVATRGLDSIRVRRGETVQFHFENGSPHEDVLLHLPGHSFTVVALDGYPVPTPAAVEVLALAPGERLEAMVEMNAPGSWLLGAVEDRLRLKGLCLPISYIGAEAPVEWHPPSSVDWSYARFSAPVRSGQPANVGTEILLEDGVLPSSADGRQRLRILNATSTTRSLRVPRHRLELTRVNQVHVAGIIKDTIRIERYSVVEAKVL